MESEVTMGKRTDSRLFSNIIILNLLGFAFAVSAGAQDSAPGGQAEISLRKTANSRVYQGREVEGEDRQVVSGDSLWRILVVEKGLSGQKFLSYVVVVRGLNPQIKNLDLLRVGDKLFIPSHPDQVGQGKPVGDMAEDRARPDSGVTVDYRIKAGEHLYQILREQLKPTDERKVAQIYALVKDLNPERKNWDTLLEGEVIRLPTGRSEAPPTVARAKTSSPAITVSESKSKTEGQPVTETRPIIEAKTAALPPGDSQPALPAAVKESAVTAAAPSKASPEAKPFGETKTSLGSQPLARGPATREQALRAPAHENMLLFAKVVESIGTQIQTSGEEIIDIKDGTVRFDKRSYPVISHPQSRQKVVLDPEGKIPASLKARLADPSVATPILPMTNNISIQEAVSRLLTGLGYQTLPQDRPVIIQDAGISYEAKGHWIALAPEQSNKAQEVFVINLAENPDEVPEYLRLKLEKNGLFLKDIALASNTGSVPGADISSGPKVVMNLARNWPRDKKAIFDALLQSFAVPFGVAETLTVELDDGLRIDTRTDRLFEVAGKRTAVFFQRADPDLARALQDKLGIRTVELDVASLSSRDLIGRVLKLLDDQGVYREHRFPAATGSSRDRLTVTAWGFHLPNRSMFVTDRQIPAEVQRFFFEKGLEIVYFQ